MEVTRDEADGAIHAQFDTDEPEPSLSVVEAVAEIEDVDETELSTIYDCIDNVLDHIFSDPPAPESDVEIAFTYEEYRIVVQQDGSATFVPLSDRER